MESFVRFGIGLGEAVESGSHSSAAEAFEIIASIHKQNGHTVLGTTHCEAGEQGRQRSFSEPRRMTLNRRLFQCLMHDSTRGVQSRVVFSTFGVDVINVEIATSAGGPDAPAIGSSP